MHSLSRNIVVWVITIAILGIVACLLPWYQLTIFGGTTAIRGYSLWQGKVVIGLCVALGLWAMIFRQMPRQQALSWITFGTLIAAVSGHYIVQVVFPAPTQIDVREGGQAARAIATDLVKHMQGHLSVGAPAALLLAIGLVVLGGSVWRGHCSAQPAPQNTNHDHETEK